MLKNSILFLLLLLPSALFSAEIPESIRTCTNFSVSYQRLDCFDALAKSLLEVKDVINPELGKWQVDVVTSPLDDSESASLRLSADSGKTRFGAPITLLIQCKDNDVEMSINWSSYMGSVPNVLTRIGTGEPEIRVWRVSKDSLSTIHPAPKRFLFSLLNDKQLVSQLTPYSSNPLTAIFDTAGLEMALKSVNKHCPL